jgi:hypothetical protein
MSGEEDQPPPRVQVLLADGVWVDGQLEGSRPDGAWVRYAAADGVTRLGWFSLDQVRFDPE